MSVRASSPGAGAQPQPLSADDAWRAQYLQCAGWSQTKVAAASAVLDRYLVQQEKQFHDRMSATLKQQAASIAHWLAERDVTIDVRRDALRSSGWRWALIRSYVRQRDFVSHYVDRGGKDDDAVGRRGGAAGKLGREGANVKKKIGFPSDHPIPAPIPAPCRMWEEAYQGLVDYRSRLTEHFRVEWEEPPKPDDLRVAALKRDADRLGLSAAAVRDLGEDDLIDVVRKAEDDRRRLAIANAMHTTVTLRHVEPIGDEAWHGDATSQHNGANSPGSQRGSEYQRSNISTAGSSVAGGGHRSRCSTGDTRRPTTSVNHKSVAKHFSERIRRGLYFVENFAAVPSSFAISNGSGKKKHQRQETAVPEGVPARGEPSHPAAPGKTASSSPLPLRSLAVAVRPATPITVLSPSKSWQASQDVSPTIQRGRLDSPAFRRVPSVSSASSFWPTGDPPPSTTPSPLQTMPRDAQMTAGSHHPCQVAASIGLCHITAQDHRSLATQQGKTFSELTRPGRRVAHTRQGAIGSLPPSQTRFVLADFSFKNLRWFSDLLRERPSNREDLLSLGRPSASTTGAEMKMQQQQQPSHEPPAKHSSTDAPPETTTPPPITLPMSKPGTTPISAQILTATATVGRQQLLRFSDLKQIQARGSSYVFKEGVSNDEMRSESKHAARLRKQAEEAAEVLRKKIVAALEGTVLSGDVDEIKRLEKAAPSHLSAEHLRQFLDPGFFHFLAVEFAASLVFRRQLQDSLPWTSSAASRLRGATGAASGTSAEDAVTKQRTAASGSSTNPKLAAAALPPRPAALSPVEAFLTSPPTPPMVYGGEVPSRSTEVASLYQCQGLKLNNNFLQNKGKLKLRWDVLQVHSCFRDMGLLLALRFHDAAQNIRWLDLSQNRLSAIPIELGSTLPNLEHLYLHGNRISSFDSFLPALGHAWTTCQMWIKEERQRLAAMAGKDVASSSHRPGSRGRERSTASSYPRGKEGGFGSRHYLQREHPPAERPSDHQPRRLGPAACDVRPPITHPVHQLIISVSNRDAAVNKGRMAANGGLKPPLPEDFAENDDELEEDDDEGNGTAGRVASSLATQDSSGGIHQDGHRRLLLSPCRTSSPVPSLPARGSAGTTAGHNMALPWAIPPQPTHITSELWRSLTHFSLRGNPLVERFLTPELRSPFKAAILAFLPRLMVLDNTAIISEDYRGVFSDEERGIVARHLHAGRE